MNRAFSKVTIKAISEDERVLEGVASTPESDRGGDVVESVGATFKLPLPLLLDHDSRQVVGEVERATVTGAGITFQARIKNISEPGEAKDLCDKAWAFIKNGLRKYVSIGFRPIEYSYIEGGGVHHTLWEWLELSAVAIPMHQGAEITSFKSMRGRPPVKVDVPTNLKGAALVAHIRHTERQIMLSLPWEKACAACRVEDIPWLAANHPSRRKSVRVVRIGNV